MHRIPSVLAALLMAAALAGCIDRTDPPDSPASTLPPGDHEGILVHDGRDRSYLLHVPEASRDGPVPLLVMLHGGLGDAANMRDKSGMDHQADALGFAVVYPEGIGKTWNAAHCCGEADRQDVDDVGFLIALIDHLGTRFDIDADRVGVAGHSNGAMMAYRLAAERSDRIASVASVAGAIGGQKTPWADEARIQDPAQPVSVLIIHARDDPNVPYDGGRSGGVSPLRIDMSVAQAVSFWLDADGITAPPATFTDGPVTRERHTGGSGGTEVLLITTEGGHGWPGDDRGGLQGALVTAPSVPDASAEVAGFFLAHPMA